MSEMLMEHMGMIEAAVESLDAETRDAAITNALSYAQGFAAGMMFRDAEKEKKGA